MRILLTLILLLGLHVVVKCQPGLSNPKIDSLTALVNRLPDDTIRVNTLNELSAEYINTDYDKSIEYGKSAEILAEKINFQKGKGYAYKAIANGYFFKGNYPEAINYYQNSLAVFERIQFKKGISNILGNIGAVYLNVGHDSLAVEYHLKSLKIGSEINDSIRIGSGLNNLGVLYNSRPGSQTKALEYYRKALHIFGKIEYQFGVAIVSLSMAEIYNQIERYDSAIWCLEICLSNTEKNSVDATYPLSLLGHIYTVQNDFDRAYRYQHRAIKIADSLNAKLELTQSIIYLADAKHKQGNIPESINNYVYGQKLAEQFHYQKELKNIYDALSILYAKTNDFKKAYTYGSLSSTLKDSLNNKQNDNKEQRLKYSRSIDAQFEIQEKGKRELELQKQKNYSTVAGLVGIIFVIVAGGVSVRFFQLRKIKRVIEKEKERSENLLLNILPPEIAGELKVNGKSLARNFDEVTILFTDFKDFTSIAETLSPQALVEEINTCFVKFDEIITKHGIEKIKTIGDSYMAAGGLSSQAKLNAKSVVLAGIEMQAFMESRKEALRGNGLRCFEMRAGIHTGPVVAGIVGVKKFQYDIWGSTVNIASRMETNGAVGKVNISKETFEFIKDDPDFDFESRGMIEAKNVGKVDMYFVVMR